MCVDFFLLCFATNVVTEKSLLKYNTDFPLFSKFFGFL